jgi:hypothetical protein
MCLIQEVGFDCIICGSPETFVNNEEKVMMCGGCDSVIPKWLIIDPVP